MARIDTSPGTDDWLVLVLDKLGQWHAVGPFHNADQAEDWAIEQPRGTTKALIQGPETPTFRQVAPATVSANPAQPTSTDGPKSDA